MAFHRDFKRESKVVRVSSGHEPVGLYTKNELEGVKNPRKKSIPGHEQETQWSNTRQCKWSYQDQERTKSCNYGMKE